MTERRKIYWNTSCFIAYINSAHPDEAYRIPVCIDVLECAEKNVIELWTSVFTIAEVIRRKLPPEAPKALPKWAKPIIDKAPEALPRVQESWDFQCRKTSSTRAMQSEEVAELQRIFGWPFINLIQVDELVARKAVTLSQRHGLKAADAIHAASAIERRCECIQAFDKDYSSLGRLIRFEEPQQISDQSKLPLAALPSNSQ